MPTRTSSRSTSSSKRWNGTHWIDKELDDAKVRHRFIEALRRRKAPDASLFTPYWKSDFIDWLVFEGTLNPCGARVESITPDFVTFEANCSGMQPEGICLDATFVIPTSEFTRSQLKQMVHDFGYYPCEEKPVYGNAGNSPIRTYVSYGPFTGENITELEWWYDGSYDERNGSDEQEMV